jgi:hypothetical protein
MPLGSCRATLDTAQSKHKIVARSWSIEIAGWIISEGGLGKIEVLTSAAGPVTAQKITGNRLLIGEAYREALQI